MGNWANVADLPVAWLQTGAGELKASAKLDVLVTVVAVARACGGLELRDNSCGVFCPGSSGSGKAC